MLHLRSPVIPRIILLLWWRGCRVLLTHAHGTRSDRVIGRLSLISQVGELVPETLLALVQRSIPSLLLIRPLYESAEAILGILACCLSLLGKGRSC